jgi:alpha-beta hydrolase superfamily lysophospholipase
MKHQEGFFKTIGDASIYYQCWLPEGEPKAALIIVHGFAEHSGRYTNVVEHFVSLGYAVYGLDHLGHGRSDGLRAHAERFEEFTRTLKVFCDMVHDGQPEKPTFLLGHSLGGLIGAMYLLEHQAEFTGAILSAPCIQATGGVSPITITMGKVLSVLMPKFRITGIDAAGVSRDPAVVQAYVDDPLVFTGKMTARLGAELLEAMQRIVLQASRIVLPILILQGSDDLLVCPDGARELYDGVGSTDKTILVYEGLYHEVFNEPERGRVLSDVEAWLEAHLAKQIG